MEHQTVLTSDKLISNSLLFIVIPITILFLNILIKHFLISPYKTPPIPPGPKPWPIIGNLLQIGTSLHVKLAELAKIHGPLISLKLGTQTLVVASSPEAAAEILRKHDRLFSGRYLTALARAQGVEISRFSLTSSTTCGEQWKLMRSLCRAELFSSRAVDSQAALRRRKAGEMVDFLARREGRAVDLKQVASVVVFNVLSNLFFSKDMVDFEGVESGNYGLKRPIDKLMELGARPSIAEFFPCLDVFFIPGLHKESFEFVNQFYCGWKDVITERRERLVRGFDGNKERDFLDAMLEREFDDQQINSLTVEVFAAGTDTTTTIVEWAMAELMRNKEAMDRAREELIAGKFNHNSADSESLLAGLPYLNACLKETLRLHAPTPFLLPRSPPETCEVMGYTVPKNSMVFVNVWAIGRDPDVWEEPLVFNPERFLCSDLDYKGFTSNSYPLALDGECAPE